MVRKIGFLYNPQPINVPLPFAPAESAYWQNLFLTKNLEQKGSPCKIADNTLVLIVASTYELVAM